VAAAATIKAERAQAKLRQEAVSYLAGVDCRYYPEAEAALIASLRADRDECVRWEAAQVIAGGCCFTPPVIAALKICASGSEEDGNPGERSTRVRMTAVRALQLAGCAGALVAPSTGPEASPASFAVPVAGQEAATAAPARVVARPPLPPSPPTTFVDLWQKSARATEPSQAR
jgi:hypothetical protein